jgi:hypothetical protein
MRNMTNPRKASIDVMRVVGRTPASLAGARVGTVVVATVVMMDAFYCASPVSAAGRRRRRARIGMKHTASAKKSSSARGTSRARKSTSTGRRFAVCVDNKGYEASLERNKIYVVLPDKDAYRDGDIRVVDESGDDYLFTAERFVPIDVPAAVKASLLKAS